MSDYDEGYDEGGYEDDAQTEAQQELLDSMLASGHVKLKEEPKSELVVEANRSYERPISQETKQTPSQQERENAALLLPDEYEPYLKSGIRLREPLTPEPRELTTDEATTQAAVEVAGQYRERAQSAEAQLQDWNTARSAYEHVEAVNAAWEDDQIDEAQAAQEHLQALRVIEGIEDDQIRIATYEAVAEYVDPDLYESHVLSLQQRYAEAEREGWQEQVAGLEEAHAQNMATLDAVLTNEAAHLDTLPEVARGFAVRLLQARAPAIMEMTDPAEIQIALRYALESARIMADQAEGAATQAGIVRAFGGQNRLGVSGREMKNLSAEQLGLTSNFHWTDEMSEIAMQRAREGVQRDNATARRQWTPGGMTGEEAAAIMRRRVAALTGTPIR